jgi:hypothetical protein
MFIEALQKSNSMEINKLLKIKTGTVFFTKKINMNESYKICA